MARTRKAKKRSPKLIKGVLSKRRQNYGFVRRTEGEDIFIPSRDMAGAMDGDQVLISLSEDRGKVEKILSRASREIIGSLVIERNQAYVIPLTGRSPDVIHVEKKSLIGASSGDRVAVGIIKWPDRKNPAKGIIKEIISRKEELAGESKALLRAYGFMEEFPSKTAKEAAAMPARVGEEEIAGRRDFRD